MKRIFFIFGLIVFGLFGVVNEGWSTENDVHDFSQNFSQLLNNNASISSINISNQGYPIKSIIITCNYNKNINPAVTINVKVGNTNFAPDQTIGNKFNGTKTFNGNATGAISINFTNNTGSGTGHGTFNVTNIRLVEGVSSTYTITAQSNNNSYGTVSLSNNVITGSPKSGYHYANPAYIVSPINSATIIQNGNEFIVSPSANTTITINFEAIPSHTINWYSNTELIHTQTAQEGVSYSNPGIPDNCNDTKIFVGWTKDSNYSNKTNAPLDLFSYTSDSVINRDVNYYATFATSTPGYKWMLIDPNDINESGTYALVSTDNYAFNGSISSGHGQHTTNAFSFINEESASAPTGTCELSLTKVSGGFTMYNTTYGYLYATKAASGGLAWNDSESSYWSYTYSNWTYNSNSAYLRTYDNTFRTYGNNSNNVLKFAKKVISNYYTNYATICQNYHTVTFNNSIGNNPNSQQCIDGESITLPSEVEISNECLLNRWEFVGWVNDKNSTQTISSITPSKDTTLYALFKIMTSDGEYVTDTITYNKIGLGYSGNGGYTNFNDINCSSNAIYNGQIYKFPANSTDTYIQIRTSGSNSGIINSIPGGQLYNLRIKWNSNTSNDRALKIYTSDTAYHNVNDLYVKAKCLDSISKGVENLLLDNKQYIGIRSKNNALYIDTIFITWSTAHYDYSTNPQCYETNISVAEWFEDSVKFDIGNYESIYKYDGPMNSCDSIRIKITNNDSKECIRWFQVPIFAGAHILLDNSKCDVVILGDSVLTITNNIKSANVTIYPGGVLEVGTQFGNVHKTYTMKSLTLRRDNDSVPQLLLHNDGFLDVKTKMFFEMRTDAEDWRWLSLPDTLRLSEISGKSEVLLRFYDGEERAKNGKGGWKDLDKDTLPGTGMIFGLDDDFVGSEKRIYKFRLDTNILSMEKSHKTVKTQPYQWPGKPINDLGWNLVGNPYLTTYNVSSGFGAVFNVTDSLVKEFDDYGNWTGRWITEYKHLRYIVVPSDKQEQHVIDAGGYEQICLEDGYKLKPFTSFFVQAKGSGDLVFYHGQRVANAPARITQTNDETFLRINVGNIKTGCYISNKFTDEYEIGDDMESLYSTYQYINNYKLLYSAINDSIIEHGIQIHGSGKVSLDDKTDISRFSEISVFYNSTWFNLLAGDQPNVQGDFILFAKRIANDVPTDIEMITNDNIEKFIYKANMYIKKNNHIYNILGGCVK